MLTAILTGLIIFSAALHIRAEYQGPQWQIYLFKPVTMLLILLMAWQGQTAISFYQAMIMAGLMASLVGDIFLMLPADRFVPGLIAFLIAHLLYSVAFGSTLTNLIGWPLIPLVGYGLVIYLRLAPYLGQLKWPVVIYGLVILMMAWLAWARWLQADQGKSLLALIGAGLFVASDTTLALNRFRHKFTLGQALTLTTYFSAQWFIALSVGG